MSKEHKCELCHDTGMIPVGTSGSNEDGNATIYEDCDCGIIEQMRGEPNQDDIRAGFTKNAQDFDNIKNEMFSRFQDNWDQFDGLMVQMLSENDRLKNNVTELLKQQIEICINVIHYAPGHEDEIDIEKRLRASLLDITDATLPR